MRKFSIGVFIALLMCVCYGCDMYDNCGYPKEVVFPTEGGELILRGERMFTPTLQTFSGTTGEITWCPTGDTTYQKLDWLFMRSTVRDLEIIVKADTNNSGRKRTLYIDLWSPGTLGSIKVIQNK